MSLAGIATRKAAMHRSWRRRSVTINQKVEEAIAKSPRPIRKRAPRSLAAGLKATMALIDGCSRADSSDESKYDIRHELEIKRAQLNCAGAGAASRSAACFRAFDRNRRVAAPRQPIYDGRSGVRASPSPRDHRRPRTYGQPGAFRSQILNASLSRSGGAIGGSFQGSAPAGELASNKLAEQKFSVSFPQTRTSRDLISRVLT